MPQASDILKLGRLLEVVDIGANPIDPDQPYAGMLGAGLCRVTGFEPQAEICRALSAAAGPHERYLPYALGDGTPAVLHQTAFSGMSSLLKPDPLALETFQMFRGNAEVVATHPVETRRLDEIPELAHIDFLKIDVQGKELDIFRHGTRTLANTVVLQAEISFVPLYEEQPGFGEIDVFLRGLGFIPHTFTQLKHCMVSPLVLNNEPRIALHQLLEGDLVYVRDFIHHERMTDDQLKSLALVSHYAYESVDIALRCVGALESRGALPKGSGGAYLEHINQETLPRMAARQKSPPA